MDLFYQHYDGDETWDTTDIDHEIKLLKERKNDVYPQGRDNVKKFLKDCQGKGVGLKIKAKKTKPYWTWYYEIAHHTMGRLAFGGLSMFINVADYDETWEGDAGSVPKELKLLADRKNDTYPQGRDNVEKFLKFCQDKKLKYKIKAKKTKPYWTWYYQVIA